MTGMLTEAELREALARDGLRLRPGEEAQVLRTARSLREARDRVAKALEEPS